MILIGFYFTSTSNRSFRSFASYFDEENFWDTFRSSFSVLASSEVIKFMPLPLLGAEMFPMKPFKREVLKWILN